MTEKAKKYLADMLQAVELIESFTSEINDFADYQTDLKTKSAVERQLGIIGEAANKFRKEEQEFELMHTQQIINFRNRLIHAYHNVDDTIVWAILQNHLPVLKAEVKDSLEK